MRFESWIKTLEQNLIQTLPGPEAQYRMAPQYRDPTANYLKLDPDPRRSSVLILLYPGSTGPMLVLTERHEYAGTHSAQVSLPGGSHEPGDATPAHTALRETEEEVGVKQEDIELLGRITELYIPPSRFLVQPFVGFTGERPHFKPDHIEVKELLEVPVSMLTHPETVKRTQVRTSQGLVLEAPYYDIQGRIVWGATAMILSEFVALMKL